MANIPIKIYWYGPGLQEKMIDSIKTDAQGNYVYRQQIDISRFSNQSFEVAAVVPNGFISFHDIEHPTVGASLLGYSGTFSLPRFVMYQKTNVTINLQRNSNDAFTEFQLYYNYGGRDYWLNFDNLKPSTSLKYNVSTAAGVKTYVHWLKKQSSATSTMYRDSLIPLSNQVNSITIPF